MFAKAVKEGLVAREVRGECVVYHVRDRRICRLNRTALFVWKQCDGQTSVSEIAGRLAADSALPAEEAIVRSALADLRRFGLVEFPEPAQKVETRRELVVRLAKTAAVAALMPLVVGIASPARAELVASEGQPCGQGTNEQVIPGRPSLGTRLVVTQCAPGLVCQNGKCVKPCKGQGEACIDADDTSCCQGLVCSEGVGGSFCQPPSVCM